MEAAEAAGALFWGGVLGSSQTQPSRIGCCVTHRVHSDALHVLSCLETESTTIVGAHWTNYVSLEFITMVRESCGNIYIHHGSICLVWVD